MLHTKRPLLGEGSFWLGTKAEVATRKLREVEKVVCSGRPPVARKLGVTTLVFALCGLNCGAPSSC
jgi:hypothetical protein